MVALHVSGPQRANCWRARRASARPRRHMHLSLQPHPISSFPRIGRRPQPALSHRASAPTCPRPAHMHVLEVLLPLHILPSRRSRCVVELPAASASWRTTPFRPWCTSRWGSLFLKSCHSLIHSSLANLFSKTNCAALPYVNRVRLSTMEANFNVGCACRCLLISASTLALGVLMGKPLMSQMR